MASSSLSDLFEYLCYGSTIIRNIFYSYSAGINFSRQNLTSTNVMILTTKVDPHAVRVRLLER